MNRGFTLVELIVSVAIFTLVISAAAGLLVNGLKAQRRALAYQELADQVSFAVEDISRSARMAKKELLNHTFNCLSVRGRNYENTGGSTAKLRFIKYDYDASADVCHEFFLEGGQIKEFRKNLTSGVETTQPLTSTGLQVTSLIFRLAGETQTDNIQPEATFFLNIQTAGQQAAEAASLKIQTSISQRNLDVTK